MGTIIVFVKNMRGQRWGYGAKKRFRPFCQIPLIFSDFEKDLSKNQFDGNFLKAYHEKLMFHLEEIFTVDKSVTDCFQDDDFVYKGRD